MNELTKNNKKFMTIKEVAMILNVSRDLIEKRINELYPDKMKKGITTYLNQKEVTEINLRIQENSSLITSDDRRKFPKTILQKKLIIKQAIDFLNEEIEELKAQNEIMRPKAVSYDTFINADGLHSMSEVAKIFKTGRTRLFKILRDNKYFYFNNSFNEPYQQYIDSGYFEIKQKVINTGQSAPVIKVTSKGIILIEKILNKLDKK